MTQKLKVLVVEPLPEGCENKYPWEAGDCVLLLGEIEGMSGHVAVATHDGRVHWGYDEDNFREATEDEI